MGSPTHIPSGSFLQLELPHIPKRRSIVQTGENIFYPRPRTAILRPAQLNNLPQLITEPNPFRWPRFPRPNPLHDRMDCQNIRLDLEVGVVPAQHLEHTSADCPQQ